MQKNTLNRAIRQPTLQKSLILNGLQTNVDYNGTIKKVNVNCFTNIGFRGCKYKMFNAQKEASKTLQ